MAFRFGVWLGRGVWLLFGSGFGFLESKQTRTRVHRSGKGFDRGHGYGPVLAGGRQAGLPGAGHRRGDQQDFRIALATGDQAVRQARIKMRRVSRLQIVSLAGMSDKVKLPART